MKASFPGETGVGRQDSDLDGPSRLLYRPSPMRHASRLCLLLPMLMFIEPLPAFDAGGPPAPGVLILRNGEVLAGITTKAGDRYVVALNQGGELRIPTRDVEMHCLDLDEAYRRKRAGISARDASARLQLADWCLRYGLQSRAADELLAAQALAPNDPRIPGLERRLHSAIRLRERCSAEPRGAPPLARRPEAAPPPRQLPSEAIGGFASRIQPLLLNRCGASACHGLRSPSDFQLVGPGLGKTVTQKYTQRNLAAVLQQVDIAQPEASPLLTVPAKPHASLPTPVFAEHEQPQLELLKAWVRTAGQATPPAISVAASPGHLLQTSLRQPVPLPAAGEASGGAGPSLQAAGSSAANNLGNASPSLDFRDPFDPERFNRQFLQPVDPDGPARLANDPETPGYSTEGQAAPAAQQP